jgi:hypothetical protein
VARGWEAGNEVVAEVLELGGGMFHGVVKLLRLIRRDIDIICFRSYRSGFGLAADSGNIAGK